MYVSCELFVCPWAHAGCETWAWAPAGARLRCDRDGERLEAQDRHMVLSMLGEPASSRSTRGSFADG